MIKVTFYSVTDNKKYFSGLMNIKKIEKFIIAYKNFGGFNRFEYDIWGESVEKLPYIIGNVLSFNQIYQQLYGEN